MKMDQINILNASRQASRVAGLVKSLATLSPHPHDTAVQKEKKKGSRLKQISGDPAVQKEKKKGFQIKTDHYEKTGSRLKRIIMNNSSY